MKTRCFNKNRVGWKNYGGRGISICKEWLNFDNFKSDMYDSFLLHFKEHGAPDTTLDRIDVSKYYSKENCRWATKFEQSNNPNSRRKVIYGMYQGKKMTAKEIAKVMNRSYLTIYSRIGDGKSLDAPFRKSRSPIPPNNRGI